MTETLTNHASARGVNHLAPELKPIHFRLEVWGRWMNGGRWLRAWPVHTMLARVIEGGPDWAVAKGKATNQMPDEVENVNSAITSLEPVDQDVTRKYYLAWAPPEVMAQELCLSKRTFDSVLQRARWQIRGYLLAVESTFTSAAT